MIKTNFKSIINFIFVVALIINTILLFIVAVENEEIKSRYNELQSEKMILIKENNQLKIKLLEEK